MVLNTVIVRNIVSTKLELHIEVGQERFEDLLRRLLLEDLTANAKSQGLDARRHLDDIMLTLTCRIGLLSDVPADALDHTGARRRGDGYSAGVVGAEGSPVGEKPQEKRPTDQLAWIEDFIIGDGENNLELIELRESFMSLDSIDRAWRAA